jgi:acyl-CoA thioesterase YciA
MAEDDRRPIPSYAPMIRTIAMPADTNPEGDIFGGWLMSQMDLAGATLAFDLAKGRCATVAVSEIVFLNPVSVGDEVSLFAEVIAVGRTSIRVAVEAWRRRRDASEASQVTKGVFVYVAIDNDRKPRAVMG